MGLSCSFGNSAGRTEANVALPHLSANLTEGKTVNHASHLLGNASSLPSGADSSVHTEELIICHWQKTKAAISTLTNSVYSFCGFFKGNRFKLYPTEGLGNNNHRSFSLKPFVLLLLIFINSL